MEYIKQQFRNDKSRLTRAVNSKESAQRPRRNREDAGRMVRPLLAGRLEPLERSSVRRMAPVRAGRRLPADAGDDSPAFSGATTASPDAAPSGSQEPLHGTSTPKEVSSMTTLELPGLTMAALLDYVGGLSASHRRCRVTGTRYPRRSARPERSSGRSKDRPAAVATQ